MTDDENFERNYQMGGSHQICTMSRPQRKIFSIFHFDIGGTFSLFSTSLMVVVLKSKEVPPVAGPERSQTKDIDRPYQNWEFWLYLHIILKMQIVIHIYGKN